MDKIEQAREALKPFAAMADELANEPSWKGVLEHDHPLAGRVNVSDFRRAAEVFASLSPTTPVDGVGAEPRVKPLEWEERSNAFGLTFHAKTSIAWYIVATSSGEGCKGTWYWFVAGGGINGWANSEREAKAAVETHHKQRVLSALASPEAEARLRERVADAESRYNKATVDIDALERRAEAAEARLAQAEGGPAVTEAMALLDVLKMHKRGVLHSLSRRETEELQSAMHSLEAALHPQSAAGEEGKP